jgi:hypothetical protein
VHIGDDEVETPQEARRNVGVVSARPRRRQLDEADPLVDLFVDVYVEADLLERKAFGSD